MSKEIDIVLTVQVADVADIQAAAESLFNTACQHADEDLIESVDDWKVNHA